MKISKSKQELARIIRDSGGWRDGEFSVMCRDGEVLNSSNKPFYDTKHGWCCGGGFGYNRFVSDVVAKNWHQTILSRAEYFHLYPAPDADGWIEWSGGECPVDSGTMVVCKVRTGKLWRNGKAIAAGVLRWSDADSTTDIIAYRLHKPKQANPEPVAEAKPTIEQLAADYRNKLDYANRKQDEADKANMDSDAALSELEKAIAAIGFAITPIDAVAQYPEPMITDWRDLQIRDEVEVVVPNGGEVTTGERGVIVKLSSTGFWCSFPSQKSYWYYNTQFKRGDVKFIRRPAK